MFERKRERVMRRFGSLGLAAAAAFAVMLFATRARADIVLYDKDGWGFYTRGQVAGFYQLMLGDAAPLAAAGHPAEVGGVIDTGGLQNSSNNSVVLSRVRSGFVGTQIGFGVRRDLSETVHVDTLMAVSLQDISGGQNIAAPEGVDFREAWGALVTPYGSFRFGRMFSIFGSASAQVVLLAFRYGIGQPCIADGASIACGSVGAGPLYAAFNSEFRYVTPRLAGFEAQLSVGDPISGQVDSYTITPLPRFDAEINYDKHFGEQTRLRVIVQGVTQELQRNSATGNGGLQTANIWGAMGSAILESYGAAIGIGGWQGSGIGVGRMLEVPGGANESLSYDDQGTLRNFRGYYGNVAYDYHGSRLAVGAGIVYVQATAFDLSPMSTADVLSHTQEGHVVFTQRFDTFTVDVEYMRWMSLWNSGATQNDNFASVGTTFTW
jgi:hypothetical protein